MISSKKLGTVQDLVFQRKSKERKHFRTNYLTDGSKLVWEYPRATPDGNQMDFVEVMEIKNGLTLQLHFVRTSESIGHHDW